MIVYDPEKRRWETGTPEVLKALLEQRERIKAVMLLTSYFIEEVRERPTTHYTHDRFIARLNKLSKILDEIYILKHTDIEIRPIFLFSRQTKNLKNFVTILTAYKDEVKRKRLAILEFIYPFLYKTLSEVLSLRVLWYLKGTYYNRAYIEYEIYCNEYTHEVREWIHYHISTKRGYYTKSISFPVFENIVKKAIERKEAKNYSSEYLISLKNLFKTK